MDNVSQKCIKVHTAICQDDEFVLDTKKKYFGGFLKAVQEELKILRKRMIFADLQTFY